MKKNYFALAASAALLLLSSCMDGGYGSTDDITAEKVYGNNSIQETNVVTLKQLRDIEKPETKEVYAPDANGVWGMQKTEVMAKPYDNVLSQYRDYLEVTEDVQIKLRITGNDIGGNIYNKIFAQDANGDAIAICVYSGGLFAYLPVGQEILVDLKGLFIGTYGYQPQIGTPYTTSSGNTYPGRMAVNLWQKHFKLLGFDPTAIEHKVFESAADFANSWQKEIDKHAGKLVTIKNVEINEANGTATWAPESTTDFSISRTIKGLNSDVVIYTSTSAKFAGDVIPTGKVDITGIFSRYSNTWQILLRDINDVKKAE